MTDRTGIELDAQAAYEAIRSINHTTIFTGDGIPAPVVYRVLGFLQSAGGYGLAQALGQIARGLDPGQIRNPRSPRTQTSSPQQP